jgi:mitogen-activated protein kinase 1/3
MQTDLKKVFSSMP